jgi:hypothetical protein
MAEHRILRLVVNKLWIILKLPWDINCSFFPLKYYECHCMNRRPRHLPSHIVLGLYQELEAAKLKLEHS